eukprot:gene17542-biopygen10261
MGRVIPKRARHVIWKEGDRVLKQLVERWDPHQWPLWDVASGVLSTALQRTLIDTLACMSCLLGERGNIAMPGEFGKPSGGGLPLPLSKREEEKGGERGRSRCYESANIAQNLWEGLGNAEGGIANRSAITCRLPLLERARRPELQTAPR